MKSLSFNPMPMIAGSVIVYWCILLAWDALKKRMIAKPESEIAFRPHEVTNVERKEQTEPVIERESLMPMKAFVGDAVKQIRKEAVVTRDVKKPAVVRNIEISTDRQNKRMAHLIKRLAEQCGYEADLDILTADSCKVDIALTSNDKRIACRVSVTRNIDRELTGIRSYLASGYDGVILSTTEKRTLDKIKAACLETLSEADQAKLLFLEPDELVLFFEEQIVNVSADVEIVNGYKSEVIYRPQTEMERKTKRQAIANVILKSLRYEKQS